MLPSNTLLLAGARLTQLLVVVYSSTTAQSHRVAKRYWLTLAHSDTLVFSTTVHRHMACQMGPDFSTRHNIPDTKFTLASDVKSTQFKERVCHWARWCRSSKHAKCRITLTIIVRQTNAPICAVHCKTRDYVQVCISTSGQKPLVHLTFLWQKDIVILLQASLTLCPPLPKNDQNHLYSKIIHWNMKFG